MTAPITLLVDGPIVDVGRIVGGFVSFTTDRAGTVRIASSEARRFLEPDGDMRHAIDHEQRSVATHEVPTAGVHTEPNHRGGFRYLHIQGAVSAVTIEQTTWPHPPKGSFICADEQLTAIWSAAADTLVATTVPSHMGAPTSDVIAGSGAWMLVDGAKRDRLIWAGDLAIQVPAWLLAFGDPRPAFDSLAYLAGHQRDDGAIPGASPVDFIGEGAYVFGEYSLWWVIAVAQYARRTEDAPGVASLLPSVERALTYARSQCDATGLWLQRPASASQWKWTIRSEGHASYTSALLGLALRDGAALLGRAALAGEATALAASVRRSFWDEAAGALVDTDTDRLRHPQDANAVGVLAGAIQGDDAIRALAHVRRTCWLPWGSANVDVPWGSTLFDHPVHNRRVYPFMNTFEVDARFATGDAAGALELLRRCWGHMLEHDPASTFWEWIGPDGEVETPWASCAHGWSAGALTSLTEQVLGVRPTAAGYATVVVDPASTDVAWAAGVIPTPRGPLEVRWERTESSVDVEFSAPEGLRVLTPHDARTARV